MRDALEEIFAISDCDEEIADDKPLGGFQRIKALAETALAQGS